MPLSTDVADASKSVHPGHLQEQTQIPMTQASTNFTPKSLLDDLVRTALERSARGNATADDWRAVADIDEERARTELSSYLRSATSSNDVNPYEKHPRSYGTVAGFIGGALVMAIIWQWGVPWLQDAWAGIDYGPGMATTITYVAPLLLPLGAWLGTRLDRSRHSQDSPATTAPQTTGTFEELLRRFVRFQNRSHTRVY